MHEMWCQGHDSIYMIYGASKYGIIEDWILTLTDITSSVVLRSHMCTFMITGSFLNFYKLNRLLWDVFFTFVLLATAYYIQWEWMLVFFMTSIDALLCTVLLIDRLHNFHFFWVFMHECLSTYSGGFDISFTVSLNFILHASYFIKRKVWMILQTCCQ